MLAAAGMVHKHVNDRVLGGRQLAANDGAARDDDGDDDDGFGGGAGGGAGGGGAGGAVKGEALPWARPSVKAEQGGVKGGGGVKAETGVKSEGGGVKSERQGGDAEPPGAKRAKQNLVFHGSDNEVRQLLRGCGTFDEVVHQLRTDPDFAAAVLRCVTSAGKDKLVKEINALPRVDT